MSIWAIADLHLSFGVPNKEMDKFGEQWKNHANKIAENWRKLVADQDLVLIPGDISWALHLEDALPDLKWMSDLPGTKVMIRGNHDYWWNSLSKIKKVLPSSIHLIQNDSFQWRDFSIGGARLWDVPGISFRSIINLNEKIGEKTLTDIDESAESKKIYERELGRLELSLRSMNSKSNTRIVMTHYPPIGPNMEETEASRMLEKYKVDVCVFGHLHNVKSGNQLFGEHNGIRYYLTSCDSLENFQPLKLF